MVKSVISIDVDDAQFRQFNRLFQDYQKALKRTPLDWKAVAQAQMGGVKGFRELVQLEVEAIGKAKILEQAHKSALNLTREQASVWQKMQRTTTGVATNIRDITTSLMQWGKVTGIIGGLLGAGGLFGVSRLAQDVAGGRRAAMGSGASYGEQKAFQTNFDRFGDSGSILSGVNASLAGDRSLLYGAGLQDKDLTGGTAQVGARLIQSLKKLADETPDNLIGFVHQGRRVGELGFSLEDFQRLKRSEPGEVASQIGKFSRDARGLDVNKDTQRVYADLAEQLGRAGQQIENVFVRGLKPLAPGISKLSESVVKAVDDLTKAIPPDAMENIGKGIEEFGKYLGSEEFRTNVKAFAGGIKWVADKIIDLGIWAGTKSGGVAVGTASAIGSTIFNPAAAYGPSAPGTRDMYGGLIVKPGAGSINPGLGALARTLSEKVPGINRLTAANDDFHKGRKSAHNEDRAFDLTIKDPSKSAEVADLIRKELARQGIAGRVIDEYRNPSPGSTGGHLHVQTERKLDVTISNTPGSSIVVQTRQLVPPS